MINAPPPPPPLPPPPGGFGGAPFSPFGAPPPAPLPPRRPSRPPIFYIRLILFIVCMPALVIVVWVIISFERQKKHDLIVFDNRTSQPAKVSVDGKQVTTIDAQKSFWIKPVVELPAGAKKIVVTSSSSEGDGQIISQVDLQIRPREKNEEHGYRGLYVIGAAPDYVIAKVPYYAEQPDNPEDAVLIRLARPSPLTELPRELESFQMSSIDGPFSDSEKVPKGSKVVWKTQLCTVVDATKTPSGAVGCSGFAGRHAR